MGRPLRIEYPGAWYHVMNRGRRSEKIFLFSEDYEEFITVLQETCKQWDLKISAYCLMPNHYHLLVQTPLGNISRCMRHINGIYTQRYNRTHETEGQLFRGRYKAVAIEESSYLLEVLRYIHRNPLKAKITDTLESFKWSSHAGYLYTTKKWNWLHKDFILDLLARKKSQQLQAYKEFVLKETSTETEIFYSKQKLPSILVANLLKQQYEKKLVY